MQSFESLDACLPGWRCYCGLQLQLVYQSKFDVEFDVSLQSTTRFHTRCQASICDSSAVLTGSCSARQDQWTLTLACIWKICCRQGDVFCCCSTSTSDWATCDQRIEANTCHSLGQMKMHSKRMFQLQQKSSMQAPSTCDIQAWLQYSVSSWTGVTSGDCKPIWICPQSLYKGIWFHRCRLDVQSTTLSCQVQFCQVLATCHGVV